MAGELLHGKHAPGDEMEMKVHPDVNLFGNPSSEKVCKSTVGELRRVEWQDGTDDPLIEWIIVCNLCFQGEVLETEKRAPFKENALVKQMVEELNTKG